MADSVPVLAARPEQVHHSGNKTRQGYTRERILKPAGYSFLGTQAMTNTMTIEGQTAVISFDPALGEFRGEFIGLNGGADFYASSVDELRRQGARSLQTFLDVCKSQGIEPLKRFSGKFVVRVPADLHERVTEAATAEGVSLNQWVKQALEREVPS